MKTFCIEWRGRITRDVGWDYIDADSIEEARKNWLWQHGTERELHGLCERRPNDLDVSGE